MTAWCAHVECDNVHEHRHCASCGLVLPGGGVPLCSHHAPADEWAVANRVFCDFFHRGIQPAPVVFADTPPVEWSDVA